MKNILLLIALISTTAKAQQTVFIVEPKQVCYTITEVHTELKGINKQDTTRIVSFKLVDSTSKLREWGELYIPLPQTSFLTQYPINIDTANAVFNLWGYEVKGVKE